MEKYNHGFSLDYFSDENQAECSKGIYLENFSNVIKNIKKNWIYVSKSNIFGLNPPTFKEIYCEISMGVNAIINGSHLRLKSGLEINLENSTQILKIPFEEDKIKTYS